MARTPKFRGDNFKGKWSLGSWAEQKIISAINNSDLLLAIPYVKSGVTSAKSAKEKQDYWILHKERESFGKRPDILVFEKSVFESLSENSKYSELLNNLPDNLESDIQEIIENSLLGIESEASIWQGEKMSHFGRHWSEKSGRQKKSVSELASWTAPTVIVKHEDLEPLINWQSYYKKPIYIVHVFYDLAYMLNFSKLLEYIDQGIVKAENFNYGKASKPIYQTYYGLAEEFGRFTKLAEIVPFVSQSSGGKFEADLYFEGGEIEINQATIHKWLSLKN